MASSPPEKTVTVDPAVAELFTRIETNFQTTALGPESWYLLVIACLSGSPDPELADQLYLHVINQPNSATSAARQKFIRRLREALVKCVSIVGCCKPIEAILAISQVEQDEDRDYSMTRQDWNCDADNHARATEWFRAIYARDGKSTLGLFDAHRDFQWLSTEITYGLYLSDRQVLDDTETEIVVLASIMIQNLRKETWWHIRGTRRIGVSKQDTQVLWDCIQLVAEFFEIKLNKVPTVDQVEEDV
ncbi:hypothetical protein FE257_006384 [Aspergillus nanangensis]|uniref:Carboxymuconolactone decarboxylase-like domain-containing protein n=1 Tax=Aspergillus nanangensis TaxID=2582783 RepID=A0AAD4CXW9_ASPNN|nr:hypothetical protein FE257_006384 [Aspergillus nanangensis]